MQETEYSAPLERLAGNMPFRGLRRPRLCRGAQKGFHCQFQVKRDGIQYQKIQHAAGRTPFTGGRGKYAGDRAFGAF